jgi:hypothetical protein
MWKDLEVIEKSFVSKVSIITYIIIFFHHFLMIFASFWAIKNIKKL